jgi:hypothetical protein
MAAREHVRDHFPMELRLSRLDAIYRKVAV